ncbi:MAG: TonB family protein [Bacteroidetes bacterium]|nr:TonB family protein [Bacteroidota bacterium]
MKNIASIIVFLFLGLGVYNNAYAEISSPEDKPKYIVNEKGEKIYLNPNKMPEFPGGDKALMAFISANLRYPNTEACIQGRVVVEFIVRKEGNLSDFKILRNLEPSFDKEALRVLQLMPRWNPAIENNSAVDAKYVVPITFKFDSSTPGELSDSKQNKTETFPKDQETTIICYTEVMPQFPGGEKAMMQYIRLNLKYPSQAVKDSVQGRVVTKFVVSENGEIRNAEIIKGLSPECDLEVIRVIKCMPNWIPATQRGRPIPIYYTLPISFQLSSKPIEKSR